MLVTLVDTSLFQATCLFEPTFFGIRKHLLDLTSSNIELIAPVQDNIGLSFASPNITLSRRNKLDVGLDLVLIWSTDPKIETF